MSTNDRELVAMSISSSTDAEDAATPGGDTPDLTTAKRKLSQTQGKPPFSLSSLPQARDSRIWDRIETEYNLSLGELSALQNFAVVVRPRGVFSRVGGQGTVYKPNDERIRAEFTISNDRNITRYTMRAELLVDSGASTELKLPSRKVLQLGLRPCGRPVACRRGSTSDQVGLAQVFSPVFVQVTFTRDAIEETVEAYLSVKCDKAEYDALVAVGNSGGSDQFSTPPVAQASAATPGSSATGNREPITKIRLSPVKHTIIQEVQGEMDQSHI